MPASPAARRGQFFAARIEHPAAADRREQERQLERRAEHRRTQIHGRGRHRRARTERDVVEGAAVLPQRDLRVGAAVDVVEDHARQPPLRQLAEVFDVDRARRIEAGHPA